ncbi:spinocerebellar ataxia type 10 protein domain-containing protein [Phlebopus sp. FC_14]|nr:spinocerebellar ataxia type 10 protein domain-containing protein [Phlebopus sp. FC_14]
MSEQDNRSANSSFCSICESFLNGKNGKESVPSLTRTLDTIANDLAKDEGLRTRMGIDSPSIWPSLRQLWKFLVEQVTAHEDDISTRTLVVSLCRFTRNLVAGVPQNQQNAFENEPDLRRILYTYSSWSSTQDPESYSSARSAVQVLSNMVTTNEILLSHLWDTCMNLPEEQVIFIRYLASPDGRTILFLLILLVNCIHGSRPRQALLAKTRVGARICIALLDRMVDLYDAEESSDGSKAFDYGYHVFAHLFDGGFAHQLYESLKVADEIIAPHQTILLKLLDSYLQSLHSPSVLMGMCPMLTTCFFELSTFSQEALKSAIGTGAVENDGVLATPETLDIILPRVCEALVLVTQCLASILLFFENLITPEISEASLRTLVKDRVSSNGQVIALSAVELLRLLDVFLPRINFGKPVLEHEADQTLRSSVAADPTGFSYLKRDLVRLLGILCHKDKKVQDSIRDNDGITVIMNMCVVDERNPYLREHAIFTLHNLLEENQENQAVVNSIQLSAAWNEDGTLHDR